MGGYSHDESFHQYSSKLIHIRQRQSFTTVLQLVTCRGRLTFESLGILSDLQGQLSRDKLTE